MSMTLTENELRDVEALTEITTILLTGLSLILAKNPTNVGGTYQDGYSKAQEEVRELLNVAEEIAKNVEDSNAARL